LNATPFGVAFSLFITRGQRTNVDFAHNPPEQNSKSETRNPKQARITEILMTETRNQDISTPGIFGFDSHPAYKPCGIMRRSIVHRRFSQIQEQSIQSGALQTYCAPN
jgi:hypothetical protein